MTFSNKISVAICSLLLSIGSYADELNYNIYHLNAESSREVPNDLMQVSLSIQHQALKANSATHKVNKDMSWALQLLKNNKGIKYQTGNYNTQPVYKNSRITGWSARQNLKLSSDNFDQLSDLIGRLQERLKVDNMSFAAKPSTREKVHNELISQALSSYKNKAKIVQSAMGASNYDIVELNIRPNFQQPRYRGEMMMSMRAKADVAPAVEAGNSKITILVEGRIQLKGLN